MQCNLQELVFGSLHFLHFASYSSLLTYAAPPTLASLWVVDGLLFLWLYIVVGWLRKSRVVFLPILLMFVDAAITAESLEFYEETQRSMTLLRIIVHMQLLVYWFSLPEK